MTDAGGVDSRDVASDVEFALGEAQRRLFSERYAFDLRSRHAPRLQVRIRIEPLAATGAASTMLTHRKSLTMLRDDEPVSEAHSIVRMDLSTRSLVSLDVDGIEGEVRNTRPLPRMARVGDDGYYFDHVVRPTGASGGPQASSTITWSLERWADGRAAWCIHVGHPAGTGILSTEGYVIDPDGRIVGSILRAHVPGAGTPAQPARTIQLTTFDD